MQILLKKNIFNFISFHVNEKDGKREGQLSIHSLCDDVIFTSQKLI